MAVLLVTHDLNHPGKTLMEQENQQLAQLRDWLLPLLMNGQVTVA